MTVAVTPQGGGPNFITRLKTACSTYSGAVIALVVVLVAVIVYLFAGRKGWIDTPAKAKPHPKKTPRGKGAAGDEGTDIDDLIEKISS
jgi:hypothetical protein